MRIGYVALIAVIVTMFLSACSESTAPQNPVGTWNLSTYDGKPLPVITYGYQNTYNETLMSETLTVNSDGTFKIVKVVRRANMLDGTPDYNETYSGRGDWKSSATGINFGVDAPASLSKSSLDVRWGGQFTTKVWSYTR